jgi:hypothetical protein
MLGSKLELIDQKLELISKSLPAPKRQRITPAETKRDEETSSASSSSSSSVQVPKPLEPLLSTLACVESSKEWTKVEEGCELADLFDQPSALSTEEFCLRLYRPPPIMTCQFTAKTTEKTCNKRKVKYVCFGDGTRFAWQEKSHGRTGSFSVVFHGAISRVMYNKCEFTCITSVSASGKAWFGVCSGDVQVDTLIRERGYHEKPMDALAFSVKKYFETYPEKLTNRSDATLTLERGGYQTIEILLEGNKSVHLTRPGAMECFPVNQRLPVLEAFRRAKLSKEEILNKCTERIRGELESCLEEISR